MKLACQLWKWYQPSHFGGNKVLNGKLTSTKSLSICPGVLPKHYVCDKIDGFDHF